MSTDRIEKRVVLRAPRSRVWAAIQNSQEFGAWFGVKFDGEFTPGAKLLGRVKSPGHEHVVIDIVVEKVEPERLFSYRWHPHAIDPKVSYEDEPRTLVEFRLEDTPEGTLLFITESGFDAVPLSRRAEAFRGNDQGWDVQAANVERHVTRP